jgi:RND family efflux transporter MFP subunit
MIFKKWQVYAGFVIIIVLVCVYLFVLGGIGSENDVEKDPYTRFVEEQEKRDEDKPKDVMPVKVEVSKVFSGDLVKRVSAYGHAEARKLVVITPEAVGKVSRIQVSEGSTVKRGELLFELNDEEATLTYKRAKDDEISAYSKFLVEEMDFRGGMDYRDRRLLEAEKNYKEADKRLKDRLISSSEFESAKRLYELTKEAAKLNRDEVRLITTGLSKARLEVESARFDLRKTKCRAPFGGVITGIKIVEGQMVGTATEAMTLVDYKKIKIVAEVLENEIPALEVDRKVKIDFMAIEDKVYEGTIAHISPLIDTEKRTGEVIIYIDNPDYTIKPGMMVRIRLDAHIFHDRLLVPRSAVLERDGKRLVFIVKDGRAQWEYVQTGLENEEYFEIIPDPNVGVHGVHEGDTVITSGHYSLAHDTKVIF